MKNNKTMHTLLYSVLLVVMSLLFMNGCSDTINGEKTANMKPIVQFVNIPPEGQQFSRNPEVYWIGSDPDGLVDYYRYHIGIESAVTNAGGINAYLATLNESDWTQIDIDHTESNPYTTNVLPLTADTLNPVSNPVGQYVFIQAFDLLNEGSDIAARLFNRNDNPPQTQIFDIARDIPFVNSIFEGGIVTGLRFSWAGYDVKDYDEIGLTPPPFDFEWRLFGPFPDSTLNLIKTTMVATMILTEDAQLLGLNDTLFQCKSIQVDTVINSVPTTITVEICDTTVLDAAFFTTKPASPFYSFEKVLDVDNSLISSKLVTSSFNGVDEWVQNTKDTIFNVYKNFSSDTTVQLNYIFWIRSRDDAFVKDLTPAYVTFPVINPQYERDIAVIDFTEINAATELHAQYPKIDTAKSFWYNIIHRWGATRGGDPVIFDTAVFTQSQVPDPAQYGKTGIDYIVAKRFSSGIPIKYLLKHKVLILYNESHVASGFVGNATVNFPEILQAMDAGINVWACWRNPFNVDAGGAQFIPAIPAPNQYARYFGVLSMSYSGWFSNAFDLNKPLSEMVRNEDFIGTYSIDESQWPSLAIDTTLLHRRLEWHDVIANFYIPWLGWRDSLAALPEVNWASRAPGTEVMYLYKSKYGSNDRYDYEGSPVGHRFESNLFRTVHFNFTLLTMDSLQAQAISNSVLDWLYETALTSSTVQEDRYKDAKTQFSIDEARRQYELRLIDQEQLRQNSGF